MTPLTNVPMAKQNLEQWGQLYEKMYLTESERNVDFDAMEDPLPAEVFQRFDQVLSQCSGQQDLPFGLNVNVLDLCGSITIRTPCPPRTAHGRSKSGPRSGCRSNGVPGRVAIDRSSCTGAAGYMIPSAPCDRGPRSVRRAVATRRALRLLRGDYREKPISMLLVLCLLLALFACSNADQEAIYSSALAEGSLRGTPCNPCNLWPRPARTISAGS